MVGRPLAAGTIDPLFDCTVLQTSIGGVSYGKGSGKPPREQARLKKQRESSVLISLTAAYSVEKTGQIQLAGPVEPRKSAKDRC